MRLLHLLIPILLGCGLCSATWSEYDVVAFVGFDPAQFLIDLSTSDIWAYAEGCKTCPRVTKANLSREDGARIAENSFKLDFTTLDNDKSGSIQGEISVVEMLLVPAVHPLKDKKQQKLALITEMQGADETIDSYDTKHNGRIGLGLNTKSPTSPLDLLFGKLDRLLCLGNIVGKWGEPTPFLTIGQAMLDKTVVYKKITTAPVKDPAKSGRWIIELGGYSFGKYSSYMTAKAQLSTTTSFIGVENTFFKQIIKQLGAYESDGETLVHCGKRETAPALEFTINNQKFKLPPTSFIVDGPNDQECRVKIRHTDQNGYFVLGTPFLDNQSFCLNYKNLEVTFLDAAKLK